MKHYDHGGNIYDFAISPLDFSSNINPLGMPQTVVRAITENAKSFAVYPDYLARELVTALAKEHGCEESHISLGNGAADLIYRLCLSQRPKEALVISPGFSEYEKALELSGAHIHYYNLGEGFELDLGIVEALKGKDMVFTCNPNNPTGLLIEDRVLLAIEEALRGSQTLWVVDECFLDFASGRSMVDSVRKNPNIAVVKAFTKFYALAGLRLGYMISSNSELNQDMDRYAPPWNISAVAQIAGVEALKAQTYKVETRKYVREEAEFLKANLRALKFKVYEGQANYLLFKTEDVNLDQRLLERHILIRNCKTYKNMEEGHFRIAVRTRQENQKFIDVLKEVVGNG